MGPLIKNGQKVFVSKIPYVIRYPKIGDIVMFRHGGKNFIKRISKVQNGKYYLTGDNKKDSLDSRKIGWISREQILGKVL